MKKQIKLLTFIIALTLTQTLLFGTDARAQEDTGYTYIVMEAEHGLIGGAHSIGLDPDASGGKYTWRPPLPAHYIINVPVGGQYVLWFRTFGRDGNNDSYKVVFDSVPFIWNNFAHLQWKWHSREPMELSKGEHRLELYLRDRDEPWLDRILLTDDPDFHPDDPGQKEGSQYIYVEGEEAAYRKGMFTVVEDRDLSGGAAIKPSHGAMDYPFRITTEDHYRIFCRMKIVDFGSDSWFMRVGGKEFTWNTIPWTDPPSWIWAEVGDKDNKPIEPVHYAPGKYSISINGRESGAKLDKIIITNDPDFFPAE